MSCITASIKPEVWKIHIPELIFGIYTEILSNESVPHSGNACFSHKPTIPRHVIYSCLSEKDVCCFNASLTRSSQTNKIKSRVCSAKRQTDFEGYCLASQNSAEGC